MSVRPILGKSPPTGVTVLKLFIIYEQESSHSHFSLTSPNSVASYPRDPGGMTGHQTSPSRQGFNASDIKQGYSTPVPLIFWMDFFFVGDEGQVACAHRLFRGSAHLMPTATLPKCSNQKHLQPLPHICRGGNTAPDSEPLLWGAGWGNLFRLSSLTHSAYKWEASHFH